MLVVKHRKVFGIYAIIAVFAAMSAILIFNFYRFTVETIKCWSSEYGPLYYLASCEKLNAVGEYEAGTIYYGLERGISDAIKNAQVIFLGSSKLQNAFSTEATAAYFAKQNVRFYVLGFTKSDLHIVLPTLKRKQASPNLLIVNADPFFIDAQMRPNVVMGGLRTYWRLAKWAGLQRLQRAICPSFPSFCSPPDRTIYRSANTGQWRWQGSYYPEQSIPFNELLQHEFLENEFKTAVDRGEAFLGEMNIIRDCIVFTGIPNNEQDASAIATRLAQRLGTHLILPKVEPLWLLDDAHLNFDTAERWSTAFLSELTPVLQRCLSKREDHD